MEATLLFVSCSCHTLTRFTHHSFVITATRTNLLSLTCAFIEKGSFLSYYRLADITRKGLDKLDEIPSHKIEGNVSFKISAVLSDDSCDLVRAEDAVIGANKALEDMKFGSAGLDTAQQVIDSSGNVGTTIVSAAADPWSSLLFNLGLFVKAVDAIAKVRPCPFTYVILL
jgi:hypothetical protein